MNILREKQQRAAKKAMISWLEDPSELGKTPAKIECTGEFDLHGLHYYIYKFKKNFTGDWLMGVCGGYEGEELENCGHVFSEMKKYDSTKAKEEAVGIVEKIRAYWMHQAKLQEMFEENLINVQMQVDINKNKAAIREAEEKAKKLQRIARAEQIRNEKKLLEEAEKAALAKKAKLKKEQGIESIDPPTEEEINNS